MACKPSNNAKKLSVELEEKSNIIAGLTHDVETLKNTVRRKDERISKLESRSTEDQSNKTVLEETCQKLRDELVAITASRDEVLASNDKLKQHVKNLESSKDAIKTELEHRESLVADLEAKVALRSERDQYENSKEEDIEAKAIRQREELSEYKNKLSGHTRKSVSYLVKDMESVARYNQELKIMKMTLQKQLEKNEALEQEILTLKNNHPPASEKPLRKSQLQSPKASFKQLSKKWEVAKQFHVVSPEQEVLNEDIEM